MKTIIDLYELRDIEKLDKLLNGLIDEAKIIQIDDPELDYYNILEFDNYAISQVSGINLIIRLSVSGKSFIKVGGYKKYLLNKKKKNIQNKIIFICSIISAIFIGIAALIAALEFLCKIWDEILVFDKYS